MQFLDEVVFMPVACRQLGSRRAQNCGFSQLQSDKVVDVSARAVHRRLWMSLCFRSDSGGSCWRCLRLHSSPELVDFPSLRDGGFFAG